MANNSALETLIGNRIDTTGMHGTTGQGLKDILHQVVSNLSGYQYMGFTNGSDTPPADPDNNIFYLFYDPFDGEPTQMTLQNFGNVRVYNRYLYALKYNGSWEAEEIMHNPPYVLPVASWDRGHGIGGVEVYNVVNAGTQGYNPAPLAVTPQGLMAIRVADDTHDGVITANQFKAFSKGGESEDISDILAYGEVGDYHEMKVTEDFLTLKFHYTITKEGKEYKVPVQATMDGDSDQNYLVFYKIEAEGLWAGNAISIDWWKCSINYADYGDVDQIFLVDKGTNTIS